ncbi:MAG TPA: MgtC/SapB family protein [Candidatus Limnocylindria bacterium]|nr:MgtC/SapB family protein [Candidatus Limnocylindria bacterium]
MITTLLSDINVEIALRLALALVIGGLIGLERSYHARPAGFRTHALVCLSTSLLMLVTVYERLWFTTISETRTTLDPTRMAQGIMTGIGFLGAGAIMKDGLTVRGLTTAASIWMTAAIGILIGIGFFFPAVVASVLTLGTLSVFRWVESVMPSQFYAQFLVRFARGMAMSEADMRRLLAEHGFTIANLHYRMDAADHVFEYRMVIRSQHAADARKLADTLEALESVREFRLYPTGE